MKKFVVVGVQRSGTTLVTTLLDSHPDVFCAGELFKMRPARGKVDVRDGGYRRYISSAVHLKLVDRVARAHLVRAYLDRFFDRPGYDAIGFKLMRNHLYRGQFPSAIRYLVREQSSVIHIVRENVLKTHVSRLMAQRTGTFHGTSGRDGGRNAIEVPTNDLVRKLSRIAEQNSELRQIFEGSMPYLACTYERLIADQENENDRILGFLGLRGTRLKTPLVKLTSDNLSNIVTNLDAVQRSLHGTEFEQWI